jgi:hypothetical protein
MRNRASLRRSCWVVAMFASPGWLASAGEDCAHVLLEERMTGLVPSFSTVAATGSRTVLR